MPLYKIKDLAYPSDDRGQRSVAIDNKRIWVVFNDVVGASYEIFVGYSDDAGATWNYEQVTNVGQNHLASGLAIDNSANLHVVWTGLGWGANPLYCNIRYRVRTAAGVWQLAEAITDKNRHQQAPQIAVDSLDNLHVVWYGLGWGANPAYRNMQYRKGSSGTWEAQEAITDINADNGDHFPCLAIDSSDIVHVVWSGKGWGVNPGAWNIEYRQRVAGVWQVQEAVTDLPGNVENWQDDPSLAVDSSGNLHVAWDGMIPFGAMRSIHYRERLAGVWQAIVPVVAAPALYQEDAALAIDRGDNIHICWSADETTRIDYRLKTAAGVWGAVQTLVDRGLVEYFPMMLWAWHPVIKGVHTNIPKTGEYFIMWPGDDEQEMTAFTNLTFPRRRWLGNILIDQLYYQHCERMRR